MIQSFSLFWERNLLKIIFSIAVFLSLTSFAYYFHQNLITTYGDSRAHVNMARRVFDNITPGMAQLGGVWLPLLHLLMIPTVWNNFMWHTGISGSIVSMPLYILAVVYVYKLVFLVSRNHFSGFIAALVVALNINYLYLQSTPMTESLFVGTFVLSVYQLVKWSQTQKISDLLLSSFFFFLLTINRYEGWPVAAAAVILVFIISFKNGNLRHAEGNTIMFSTTAFFGILLWISWQVIIFHNAFYFLRSEFSAEGQTKIAINFGQVPTYKNLPLSIEVMYFAFQHVLGMIIVVLGFVGLYLFLVRTIFQLSRRQFDISHLILLLLWIPAIFLTFAIFRGNVPLDVPDVMTKTGASGYFNIRYILYSLPAVAVFGSLISRNKYFQSLILFLVISGSFLIARQGPRNIPTVQDALATFLFQQTATSDWIKNNYHGGYILLSAATNDPVIYGSGIDIRNFITEGTGKYWNDSMKNPAKYAHYVIITSTDSRDSVRNHVNYEVIQRRFKLVAQYNGINIYELQ